MKPILLVCSLLFFYYSSNAGRISGVITDENGNALPYASLSIKGTNKGTNANSSGRYSINLSPGQYTLIAQYVGYARQEKIVTAMEADQTVDFKLSIQELTLGEVVVKKGEDPAYEIVRNA